MMCLRGSSSWWAVATLLGTLGCATLSGRLENAQRMSCQSALDEHAKLVAEQGYSAEPERQEYEVFIAGCMLQLGHHKPALELARKIEKPKLRGEALALTARAAAALGDVQQAQAALEALPSVGPVYPELFLQSVEFRKYATEEWFIAAALSAWSPSGRMGLDDYMGRLLRRHDETLVPLRVAAADSGREPGEWAVWIGTVKEGRLDREKDETRLVAEGLDVRRELVAVDRKLTKIEAKWSSFTLASGTIRNAGYGSAAVRTYGTGAGSGTLTPEYETDEVYEETFTPNGVKFVVEYPGLSEQVVQAATVAVVGRYAGRDADGLPRLRAIMVAARAEQQSRQRVHDDP
jgi:hypothetical protein